MAMLCKRVFVTGLLGAMALCIAKSAVAGDLKITIPRRSHLTTVQRLNREGVDAVEKHQFDKARELFYKAYLYDPGDPFTLNNLGYVAELEGQLDRAQSFYALASAQVTEARIDRSSSSKLKGETLQSAIGDAGDVAARVDRANVRAVRLLSEGRSLEANELLHQTLDLDPSNAFTLNNLGVANEAQGEYSQALKYYDAAANRHIEEPVVVTMKASWRGKPVSEMARQSASRLRSRMKNLESDEAQVALLNLRGVSAMNRNNWREAQQDFSQAYKLGPGNAFALNNQGYIAEMEGDLESAQEFYTQARDAGGAEKRVGLATQSAAEGKKLFAVAEDSDGKVSNALETTRNQRRRNSSPIQLQRRDGSPVVEPSVSPHATLPPQ
jgi:Flp pilus assembly protein TadD